MTDDSFHLYTDLAWLWPLWGEAAGEYADYAGEVGRLIDRHARRPARTLLDVGCGGGKNMFTLKRRFDVTGVDLSPAMLVQARALNPECSFFQGDMRTLDLGVTFDAVLMDDAMSHMHTRADFTAALQAAARHVRSGGVLIATPDVTPETFRQNRTTVTPGARDGLEVVFIENVHDPDPADEQYETTIIYLIRKLGRLRVETDRWTMGIFALDTWRHVLNDCGFEVHEGSFSQDEDLYTLFACIKM